MVASAFYSGVEGSLKRQTENVLNAIKFLPDEPTTVQQARVEGDRQRGHYNGGLSADIYPDHCEFPAAVPVSAVSGVASDKEHNKYLMSRKVFHRY